MLQLQRKEDNMQEITQILNKTKLFNNINDQVILSILKCLNAQTKSYNKNDIIFQAGSTINEIGIVVQGSINVIREDFNGNSNIIAHLEIGDIFGESFAINKNNILPVSVVASSKCKILFIEFDKIISPCISNCQFHSILMRNLVNIFAQRNILLTSKMEHITKKSIKEKLLSYLNEQSLLHKSDTFSIPFNRQELADYLAVDRSALSSTMSKLKENGIIDYYKNSFKLKR
ncbi:MAG: Crp/Fnr family transcriptional regulator [Bacilli bacterium]|jgi:CRP-like cAMP-binding protein|nr:Crp/Fnr family transcriptional regulator [Bacilli bacterium]